MGAFGFLLNVCVQVSQAVPDATADLDKDRATLPPAPVFHQAGGNPQVGGGLIGGEVFGGFHVGAGHDGAERRFGELLGLWELFGGVIHVDKATECPGDLGRGLFHGLSHQVGIAGGGLNLGMPQQAPDHG